MNTHIDWQYFAHNNNTYLCTKSVYIIYFVAGLTIVFAAHYWDWEVRDNLNQFTNYDDTIMMIEPFWLVTEHASALKVFPVANA